MRSLRADALNADTRYEVEARPARFGHLAAVDRITTTGYSVSGHPYELHWTPRPTYWRPTRAWAIAVARRKQRRLTAHEQRTSGWSVA